MPGKFRPVVFDIRREGFPPGNTGDVQYREFQNLTQQLNKLVAELTLLRERMILEAEIAAPEQAKGVAYIYIDEADGDLKVKFANNTVALIASN